MSLTLNHVMIAGRITADPELKMTNGGLPVCNFTVAVERPKKKDHEAVTDFLDVTAWNESAQFVSSYFHKGDPIFVTGAINVRDYEKDGQKRRAWNISAARADFVESKKNAQTDGNSSPAANSAVSTPPQFAELPDDSDLPF